jgi:hypothetical protein
MKKYICFIIAVPTLLLSNSVIPVSLPCECGAQDTTNEADSLAKIYDQHTKKLDQIITEKVNTADSLKRVADSLEVEVKVKEFENKKKRVMLRKDRWRDVHGRVHTVKWYYFRMPDGKLRFDTAVQTKSKDNELF